MKCTRHEKTFAPSHSRAVHKPDYRYHQNDTQIPHQSLFEWKTTTPTTTRQHKLAVEMRICIPAVYHMKHTPTAAMIFFLNSLSCWFHHIRCIALIAHMKPSAAYLVAFLCLCRSFSLSLSLVSLSSAVSSFIVVHCVRVCVFVYGKGWAPNE